VIPKHPKIKAILMPKQNHPVIEKKLKVMWKEISSFQNLALMEKRLMLIMEAIVPDTHGHGT